MTQYKKENQIITPKSGKIITENGTVVNPTEEQLIDAGYEVYVAPEPIPYTPSYEELVEQYISEQYTHTQELAIQRQKESKPEEWQAYYDYCEECKERAKEASEL